MKNLDVAATTLLIIGGINWGLVGFFHFDLVRAILGDMTAASRIVYALVGLSALYELSQVKALPDRWSNSNTPATNM